MKPSIFYLILGGFGFMKNEGWIPEHKWLYSWNQLTDKTEFLTFVDVDKELTLSSSGQQVMISEGFLKLAQLKSLSNVIS